MKKIYFSLLLFMVILAGISEGQFARVITITNYAIEVEVNGEVHVKNTITVKNLINSPIVPGVGELRLQKKSPVKLLFLPIPFTERTSAIEVKNVKAYTKGGKRIPVRVVNEGEYTTIVYEIWYPIEPGREFTFVVEYDSDELAESGILFRTVAIPVGTDMEIQNINASFTSNWRLVYSMDAPRSLPAGGIAFYGAEFSQLPLPQLGVRWSVLLWSIVLLLSVIVFIYVRNRQKNVQ